MRFSGKFALKVGAVGVAAGAILAPVTAAHAATPAITVTPNTGLTDGASVTVAGTGYTAGATVAVLECSGTPDATASQCDLSALATNAATVATDGTFTKMITVKTGTIGSGTCAATSTNCLIAAGNEAATTEKASAPITFGASTPTGPAITVAPATGVNSGDKVSVSGTGFPAAATTVNVLECGSATPVQADCDISTVASGPVTAGAFGPIMVTVHTGAVGDKTCDAGGSCYIVASTVLTGQDATNSAVGTFTFAGGAPAGPTVTVTPATGVKDGGTVTVSGAGFPASQPTVYVVECGGNGGQADCDVSTLATGSTDATGAFSGVKVTVHTGAVGDKTCKAGGGCFIAAATSTTPDATNSGVGTFTFAAGTTPPPAKHHATKTKAKFSSKRSEIAGTVSSGGAGIKGLKTELELKHGHKWKTVDTAKTHSGGAFTYKNVTKSGTYEVKTLKNAKYKGSTSKKITV